MKVKILKVIFIFILTITNTIQINTEEISSREQVIENNLSEAKKLDDYLISANESLKKDRFDKALETLKEAEIKFPLSPLPNLKKGDLYSHHKLYDNALIEYLKTKEKGYLSEELYRNIASMYSKIGNDKNALKIYLEAFNKFSKNKTVYDNLGWLYFKVHNAKKGIEITKEGLEAYPNSSELLMTLGTLYSDIWDYENSKKSYYESIKYSYKDYRSNYFRSVAYYNISILEKNFLNYGEALNSANASIAQENRETPHIQIASLNIFSLNLKEALKETRESIKLRSDILLSHYLLAYIYTIAGELDNAISLLKSLENNKDFAWMQFFGMNKDNYFSEVFSYMSTCYEYKANQIKLREQNNLIETLLVPFKSVYYKILSKYYLYQHANLSIKISEELITGGSILEGINQLNATYKRLDYKKNNKLIYLKENFDIPFSDNMKRIMELEKIINKTKLESNFFNLSKRKKNIINLTKAINNLDPKWERETKAESLYELTKISNGETKENAIKNLFLLHSPYLGLYGLKLGVSIEFTDNTDNKNKIVSLIKKTGFKQDKNSNIKLVVKPLPNDVFSITIINHNKIIKTDNFSLNNKKVVSEIFDSFFIYDFKK